jgi:Predicted molecular chaperone distantly related to HSP70-fold metalloproteases
MLDNPIKVIGLMSGTSLDGLDICYAGFEYKNNMWQYEIYNAEDEQYPDDLKHKLSTAQNMSAYEYALLNSDYGLYLGKRVKSFIERIGAKPNLIASHGQTIFHQPDKRFTSQIGSGACISAEAGVDCVCDFRTTDVALYGQGAPLVPIGDKWLFSEYDYCLNMGGFSNISYNSIKKTSLGSVETRIAFDISPVNYVLNYYMRQVGIDFDKDGDCARSGNISFDLLEKLNNLDFYKSIGPKSLGREWVESTIIPLIDSYNLSLEDKLATFCEHVAIQISHNIKCKSVESSSDLVKSKVLVTGGGAFNKYLIERMQINAPQCVYCIPDKQTINFKEALIFAFLGVLYINNIPNCMSSVTGALYDCIGGALYKANNSKKI